MMNEERLRMMKKGSIFINTARGAIVDEQALVRVVQDGIIARVALDAYVVDPLPVEDSPLRALPNAILTPNMIGHTQEGALNFIATAIESVRRVLRLEPPVHLCNPEVVSRWQSWAGGAGDGEELMQGLPRAELPSAVGRWCGRISVPRISTPSSRCRPTIIRAAMSNGSPTCPPSSIPKRWCSIAMRR